MIRGFFHAWERRLAEKDDPERRVLPFAWGTEFLGNGKISGAEARAFLHRHVEEALVETDAYFPAVSVSDFRLQDSELTFSSPVETRYQKNNVARGTFFPTAHKGPAVIVLPQWNAKGGAQTGLCRLLNLFGLTALRLTLPYHGARMPDELTRADYMLSPNLGRTLQACRQAVLEARAAITWLEEEGYGPIGIIGTSLGSAIAFITVAHDQRLRTGVMNHVSPYFADVVWRGISTRHVRQGLERGIDLEELRQLWLPISPRSYYQRLNGSGRKVMLVYARYDLSFPPDESRRLVSDFERLGIRHQKLVLPCGHYSTAKFPFNVVDGVAMARYLSRALEDKNPDRMTR